MTIAMSSAVEDYQRQRADALKRVEVCRLAVSQLALADSPGSPDAQRRHAAARADLDAAKAEVERLNDVIAGIQQLQAQAARAAEDAAAENKRQERQKQIDNHRHINQTEIPAKLVAYERALRECGELFGELLALGRTSDQLRGQIDADRSAGLTPRSDAGLLLQTVWARTAWQLSVDIGRPGEFGGNFKMDGQPLAKEDDDGISSRW